MSFVEHKGGEKHVPSLLLGEEWLHREIALFLKESLQFLLRQDYFPSWEKHCFTDKLQNSTQCSEMALLSWLLEAGCRYFIKHSIYAPNCAIFGVQYTQCVPWISEKSMKWRYCEVYILIRNFLQLDKRTENKISHIHSYHAHTI